MVRDWTKDYFHEKYECYCDMVYRICMLYLKNESDARDGLQDIFLKMWEKQPVFENASHEKAWLVSTTKHYCLDVLKSSWHKKREQSENCSRNDRLSCEAGFCICARDT